MIKLQSITNIPFCKQHYSYLVLLTLCTFGHVSMHSENKPQTVARYMLLANCRNIGDDTQKVSSKLWVATLVIKKYQSVHVMIAILLLMPAQ